MSQSLIDPAKTWDIATDDGITPVAVTRLTLRQLEQLRKAADTRIRDRNREEFLSVARNLPKAEATAYLVAAAKANTPSESEIQDEIFAEAGIRVLLKEACGKQAPVAESADPGTLTEIIRYALSIPDSTPDSAEAAPGGANFPLDSNR